MDVVLYVRSRERDRERGEASIILARASGKKGGGFLLFDPPRGETVGHLHREKGSPRAKVL